MGVHKKKKGEWLLYDIDFFIKHQNYYFSFNWKSKRYEYITLQCSLGGHVDRWPAIISSADIHSSYLHIQKRKRKKCFLHSYHSFLLLINPQIFNFNVNIQFCYLLYTFFSFFFFFSYLVHVNVHKVYNSMEQLYFYLEIPKKELHWVNGLSSKEAGLHHWLSCTQHTKQNRQRNENFKWAIQLLAIATYT